MYPLWRDVIKITNNLDPHISSQTPPSLIDTPESLIPYHYYPPRPSSQSVDMNVNQHTHEEALRLLEGGDSARARWVIQRKDRLFTHPLCSTDPKEQRQPRCLFVRYGTPLQPHY